MSKRRFTRIPIFDTEVKCLSGRLVWPLHSVQSRGGRHHSSRDPPAIRAGLPSSRCRPGARRDVATGSAPLRVIIIPRVRARVRSVYCTATGSRNNIIVSVHGDNTPSGGGTARDVSGRTAERERLRYVRASAAEDACL